MKNIRILQFTCISFANSYIRRTILIYPMEQEHLNHSFSGCFTLSIPCWFEIMCFFLFMLTKPASLQNFNVFQPFVLHVHSYSISMFFLFLHFRILRTKQAFMIDQVCVVVCSPKSWTQINMERAKLETRVRRLGATFISIRGLYYSCLF
jgi:hypothetical protein